MNFKQEPDGTIQATFQPSDILKLVKLVKSGEEMRMAGIKDDLRKTIKVANEAEIEATLPH